MCDFCSLGTLLINTQLHPFPFTLMPPHGMEVTQRDQPKIGLGGPFYMGKALSVCPGSKLPVVPAKHKEVLDQVMTFLATATHKLDKNNQKNGTYSVALFLLL